MKYLTDEFLSNYRDKSPNWGPIGEIIYLRTYSRWNGIRRETWDETVARVVEWSIDLHQGANGFLKDEAQELFDLWWNLDAFPAGRSLWVGGTDHSKKSGFGNFNCSYLTIKSSDDLAELTYLLMSGSGVGFGTRATDVLNKNNPIGKKPEIDILPYEYVGNPGLLENTIVNVDGSYAKIIVGDSREGWANAVKEYVDLLTGKYGDIEKIVIDINYIRPLGTRLKTFGGKASGPEPLIDFFRDSHKVLFTGKQEWTSIKVLDVCNMIGRMVVAGGSRRSAQIALGDAYDEDFIKAKTGDWYSVAPWRVQSNNTIAFSEMPPKEKLRNVFNDIVEYGEPGFINEQEAKRRRPDYAGINPCAEILLADYSLCNLTTINLMNFVRGTSQIDWNKLERAIRLQARHNLRVTNIELELPHWNKNQKMDRLLGMSLTGFGDMVDKLNMSERNQRRLLKWAQETARDEANSYAKQMGVPIPKLVTTVKPEGTITQLPGVSSGLHPNFGPYYIRRVRISKQDAVAQALIEQGFYYEQDAYDNSTYVFSFPIKTPAKKYSYEYSAIDMLNRYKLFMKNYVEHNASITVYFDESEIDGIIDWLLDNWDNYVAVSFLKKDDKIYPQMPYERITEKQYNEFVKTMPKFDRRVLESIEKSEMQATEDFEMCSTGSCPIR